MIRIDGHYLYSIGGLLKPLGDINQSSTFANVWLPVLLADGPLYQLLYNSVFRFKTPLEKGAELLATIRELRTEAEKEQDKDKAIGPLWAYRVSSAYIAFETILAAELRISDIYLVTKKRGYDTSDLIERGSPLFPDDLLPKVPEATLDVQQGARRLAFELPTASAFHFHRAAEAVLHRYYDAVTSGKLRPTGRNIGDYLSELNKHKAGDPKVLSALKDLKDLHRNPLIHPEDTLESVDEAIAVLGSIQSVIVHMLKAIPAPPTAPVGTASP